MGSNGLVGADAVAEEMAVDEVWEARMTSRPNPRTDTALGAFYRGIHGDAHASGSTT